jgi:transcriptional regulator with XRE-family HTH domain
VSNLLFLQWKFLLIFASEANVRYNKSMIPTHLKSVPAEVIGLGARLAKLRTERGWTLEELAERSGLSASFLSRLEDGGRQPSLAALITLARVYEVLLPSLFDAPQETANCVVVRVGEAKTKNGNGLIYASLTNASRPTNMQPIRVIVPIQRDGDERYQHEGEEWLYVLSGCLALMLEDQQYTLCPGDAAHFDARIPHRLEALGDQDAEVILVACVAPRPPLESYLS